MYFLFSLLDNAKVSLTNKQRFSKRFVLWTAIAHELQL